MRFAQASDRMHADKLLLNRFRNRVHEWRFDVARANHIGANAFAGIRFRHHLGHHVDATFAGAISGETATSDKTVNRADVDDRTNFVLLQHLRRRVLVGEENSRQVHVDHFLLFRHIQLVSIAFDVDSGVGDHDVE